MAVGTGRVSSLRFEAGPGLCRTTARIVVVVLVDIVWCEGCEVCVGLKKCGVL